MPFKPPRLFVTALLLFYLPIFTGCATISAFDQYAYAQTTSLKVEAMSLMDQATEEYATHEKEIKDLELKMEKAYEYELHREKNAVTVSMWKLVKDPEKNLLGGFLTRWKNMSKLSPVFINEAKPQIQKAFDQIAELESGKIRPKDVQ